MTVHGLGALACWPSEPPSPSPPPGPHSQAVVVGGGYIGMEVAAQLAGNGVPATIICPEAHLLSRLLTPKVRAAALKRAAP